MVEEPGGADRPQPDVAAAEGVDPVAVEKVVVVVPELDVPLLLHAATVIVTTTRRPGAA